MKKFELTAESKINWFGRTLFRIKACIDFTTTSGDEVHKGDLGGFVEKESNLSHSGKAWIWGNAEVWGNAKVCGDAEVCGDASIFSTKHIFCITPIGDYANSLTVFRTKHLEIKISFEWGLYTLDEFSDIIDGWDDMKNREVARAALEVAKMHIDLTPVSSSGDD